MPAPPNRTGVATPANSSSAACWPSSRTPRPSTSATTTGAFEEFLPELEQLELSLAQPVVAVDEKGLLGDWKCRSTQADQYGIYRYPNFQCRIRRTDRGLFLEKTSGSQRVSGYLFREGTQRYVFLGGATVNDEPQVAFSGLAHGAPAESDVVALLRPHAGGFLLLFPERRGGYEVLEFSR